MTNALAHRGPHGEGLWQHDGIVLGHRRLAVTGLGHAGNQPMTRDHLTIIYNGETYNAPSLRTELADRFPFSTRTDTEVVLRAWQQWGSGALNRLSGMHALAIWDHNARTLTMARDRIGIKPLYYYQADKYVIFASEIEALLASEHVPRRPDIDVLTRQLLCSATLQVDPAQTPVAGVRALPPATALTLHPDGRQQRQTYWRLPQPAGETTATPAERADELRDLLSHSVDSMLMGDVEVAAFLSGGLDSSSIAALASTHRELPCVTTTYAGPPAATPSADDDLHHSRTMAQHLRGRIRHHLRVQPARLGVSDVDDVCDLAAIGDDPRHPAILGNYQTVRDLGLRVVLNGQGADEIMGGYVDRRTFIRNILDVRMPDPASIASLPASRQTQSLSATALALRADAHAEVLAFHRGLPGTPLDRAHRLLFHTQLRRILQFEDFLSMRTGVEARVPFLDHRIVEFAFRYPFDAHIHGPSRRGKVLLAHAMRGLLPASVLQRAKCVFPHPDSRHVQRALAAIFTEHAREIRRDPLVEELFTLPADPAQATPGHLWQLLYLWRWHRKLTTSVPVPA